LHDTFPDLEKRMKALINKKVVRNMEDAAYFLGVVSLYNPHITEAFSMLEEHGRRAVLLNTEAKSARVPWEGIYREQLKNWKKNRGEYRSSTTNLERLCWLHPQKKESYEQWNRGPDIDPPWP
ncbi:hypothetical protein D6783_05230, partial [Candidatus Woesearchaeota archaeon]